MTPRAVSPTDLRALLRGAVELTELPSADLSAAVLTFVCRLVPCDLASLNEIDPRTMSSRVDVLGGPPPTAEESDVFRAHAGENPLLVHQLSTPAGPAGRLSDFIGRRQLHRLPIYSLIYRPLAVEAQLACKFRGTDSTAVGLALNRSIGDFSDRDVAVLTAAASILGPVWSSMRSGADERGATTDTPDDPSPGTQRPLTPRQHEVMSLVAAGATNRQVAVRLCLSERTVAKHLELAFRALGVSNRTSAVAVWRDELRASAY